MYLKRPIQLNFVRGDFLPFGQSDVNDMFSNNYFRAPIYVMIEGKETPSAAPAILEAATRRDRAKGT